MEQNEQLNLLPKSKRKLMQIIFSRTGVVFLMMVTEIVMFFSIYNWFYEYIKIFIGLQYVFSVVMIYYLINSRIDASAKLTWLFLIMLFPAPSTIMLWISRKDPTHRAFKRKMFKMIKDSEQILTKDPVVFTQPEIQESGTDNLSRYLNRSGNFPLYANTDVTYFPIGEAKFEAMLEELKKAESFIFMEYFIIAEGYMWGSILKILADKAKEGVDVRVMYDGTCELALLPRDYPERMKKLGIQCKAFMPMMPFATTQYNYRDHRKILVIDGKVAFNGGVNLADEYINRNSKLGHWKDVAVKLTGDAVQSFTLLFLQMWNLDEKNPSWEQAKLQYPVKDAKGYVMPYGYYPLDRDHMGENVYMDILYRAKKYVHIMTPYLILDNELENAITYAAMRGVDVRIIVPGIPDKKIPYALAKTHFKNLLNAGVHVYTYTPGFVHAKVFVSDDEKAVVGTINCDYRSLYHHFECATYMYRTECISDIDVDYMETLTRCEEVTYQTIKEEKLAYKIAGVLLKILAPMM